MRQAGCESSRGKTVPDIALRGGIEAQRNRFDWVCLEQGTQDIPCRSSRFYADRPARVIGDRRDTSVALVSRDFHGS